MSKGLKVMLFWSLIFPVIVTVLRIIIDFFLGRDIELLSYTAVFLGFVVGGIIFVGPLNYLIHKSKK
ncbi:hypothetical protein [Ornithinibacillus xuwenensis]|uniref:Uncharacterized protein n=1 Tax=Ornithinibacillus xuwenensis TaxID=3144668 RepID=A0ABU9XCX2_9BACI